ncbi:non-hydrolyzing UDP-N-acetylglucosamine 2-epimerase [Halomonas sp. H5]|uniref:non-hydrolyzing UDP-N-acetylglucosamine 2-epimerase n=1 Tax=Halomonas sp. H5 TaxID=3423910 RepID=UPI003D3674B5
MIMFCAGTRPEIIKLAPLVAECRARLGGTSALLVDTGQHAPEVLDPLLSFFGLSAGVRFNVRQGDDALTSLNARLLQSLGDVIRERAPQAVIVQGDTASALQGAMAAFLSGIPVGHVEAGLRSGNPWQPFPEEMNRSVIGRMSQWHFAPTLRAARALRAEAVPGEVHVTGNTIVDAVEVARERMSGAAHSLLSESSRGMAQMLRAHRGLLVTMHRRENWRTGVVSVAEAVKARLAACPELACVWVLHPNPRVADRVREVLGSLPPEQAARLRLVAPLPYPDMLYLMQACELLLTDSGGIQEEAVCLGLPTLVARDETERPEVIESGWGRLVGTRRDRVVAALEEGSWRGETLEGGNPLGDGRAAGRILDLIVQGLGRAS